MSNRTALILAGVAVAAFVVFYVLPKSATAAANASGAGGSVGLAPRVYDPSSSKLDFVGGVGALPGFSGLLGVRR